jgi:hypothetical protein
MSHATAATRVACACNTLEKHSGIEQNTNMESATLVLRHEGSTIYRVWYQGQCVGTVLLHAQGPDPFWQWSITKVRSTLGGPAYGTAATKEMAMRAFREAFDTILTGEHEWVPDPPKWTPFRERGRD